MGQDPAEHLHPLPHPQRVHQLLHLLHVQLLLQGRAPLQAGEKAEAQRDGDKVQLQLIYLAFLASVTTSLCHSLFVLKAEKGFVCTVRRS